MEASPRSWRSFVEHKMKIFKGKKSHRSHKRVEIKKNAYFFGSGSGTRSGSVQMTDPDPGGPNNVRIRIHNTSSPKSIHVKRNMRRIFLNPQRFIYQYNSTLLKLVTLLIVCCVFIQAMLPLATSSSNILGVSALKQRNIFFSF
jgi:hypothetical protein